MLVLSADNPGGNNQAVSPKQIEKIRGLSDFDLTMLISDIHDHGWTAAQVTLAMMPPAWPDDEVQAYQKTWEGELRRAKLSLITTGSKK